VAASGGCTLTLGGLRRALGGSTRHEFRPRVHPVLLKIWARSTQCSVNPFLMQNRGR
jgi:hypothetical protein